MTFIRHAPRHVLHTVANYVSTGVQSMGWMSEGSVPFGAPRVDFQVGLAWIGDKLRKDVEAGAVRVSLGNEFPPESEELGGHLTSQEYPIFFDIFMDTEATALALATDIRDWLLGRMQGSKRHIPLVDQSTGQAVAGWLIELEDVERIRPESPLALHWQSVHVTAHAYFQEEQV